MATTNNLKEIRIKKRLTQRELANRANISPISISRYENGAHQISPPIRIRLSQVLECSASELIAGNEFFSEAIDVPLVNIDQKINIDDLRSNEKKLLKESFSLAKSFLEKLTDVPHDSLFLVQMSDLSMYPALKMGDLILFTLAKSQLTAGNVYLINFNGRILLKRLATISSRGIKFSSDNKTMNAGGLPYYPDVFCKESEAVVEKELEVLATVVAIISKNS